MIASVLDATGCVLQPGNEDRDSKQFARALALFKRALDQNPGAPLMPGHVAILWPCSHSDLPMSALAATCWSPIHMLFGVASLCRITLPSCKAFFGVFGLCSAALVQMQPTWAVSARHATLAACMKHASQQQQQVCSSHALRTDHLGHLSRAELTMMQYNVA